MNLQKGKKICEELGITPACLAKLCHERKIKAYNCHSGKHILASTECLTALEYPESSVFCFTANGKNIGIAENFIHEGKIEFKKLGLKREFFYSYTYEEMKYLCYLEEEITAANNNQEIPCLLEDETTEKSCQLEGFVVTESILSDSFFRVKNLPMSFNKDGSFTIDYIEFDFKTPNKERKISNIKKMYTHVDVIGVVSDVQKKFIINKYNPDILELCGDKEHKNINGKIFNILFLKGKEIGVGKNYRDIYRKYTLNSKTFVANNDNKIINIKICEDFFIFKFEEFKKYILEKNIDLEIEYFYDYIYNLCFDASEIDLAFAKKDYKKKLRTMLKNLF